jgi:glutathione S-transferase
MDRYALNFKGVHYQTEWVELPDVPSVRKKLGVAPNETHWDGSPFYTLPIIKDLSTGEIVGDSFEIALYLDKTYPNGPSLFPPSTIGLQAAFNAQADAIFSEFAVLCAYGIPFNPETAEASKSVFVWMARKEKWEDLDVRGEERAQILERFKGELGKLAKSYSHRDGPFLEGENASYADLIVGGWLQFMKASLKDSEWEEMQMWHDGLWRKIHLALEKYAEVK